jgi:hypothetical protein
MQTIAAKYLSLIKGAWLVFALFVMVCCGPVKKMIELQLDNASTTTLSIDKKLHTWYREKKDVALLAYHVAGHQPETGLTVFLIASLFSLLLFLKIRKGFKQQYIPLSVTAAMPLYLHIRKLQV